MNESWGFWSSRREQSFSPVLSQLTVTNVLTHGLFAIIWCCLVWESVIYCLNWSGFSSAVLLHLPNMTTRGYQTSRRVPAFSTTHCMQKTQCFRSGRRKKKSTPPPPGGEKLETLPVMRVILALFEGHSSLFQMFLIFPNVSSSQSFSLF